MTESYGYIRQSEHCYLRREKEPEGSFELAMLLQNPLPGLLTCRQQEINDQAYLLYDVTSCKALGDWWMGRGLQEKEIKSFVREVIHILRECERHLLDREKVVLKPELIFCDMDARQYYFLYDPFLKPQASENLRSLAQYMVEQVDYNQQSAVDLVYRIYEGVTGSNSTLRTLEQCLESPDEWAESLAEDEEETENIQKAVEFPIESEAGERVENRKFWIQKGALAISFIALLLGIWGLYRYELTRRELFAVAGIMILAVITAGCSLFSWLYRGRKDEETQELSANDYRMAEPDDRDTDTESEKTVYLARSELLGQRGLQGMGQERQRWISLGSLPFVIGKKAKFADYVLEDDSISRMHARFVKEDDRMFIMDLHSTNGTYVNGVRLEPDCKVEIQVGDQIGLGKLNFTYC